MAVYKFRMWKVWLIAAVAFGHYAILSLFDVLAQPVISAQLAVGQLENSESGAAAMRAYDRIQGAAPGNLFLIVLVFGAYVVFGTALFRVDLVQLYSSLREKS